jgi:8-oxo-dGTP pyrophosphatase MutT (NUDIX family)
MSFCQSAHKNNPHLDFLKIILRSAISGAKKNPSKRLYASRLIRPRIQTKGYKTIDYSRLREIINISSSRGPSAGHGAQLACVFLLLFDNPDPHILAIQKSDTHGYPWRNQVALPGGHLERTDPGPVAAAFRELEEELSISRDQVDFIGSIGHFQTLTKPRDIEAFLGFWNGQGPVRYDAAEISRILQIPLKTLIQVHQDRSYHEAEPDIRRLEYPFENLVIWGATAHIIYRFIELAYPLFEGGKPG